MVGAEKYHPQIPEHRGAPEVKRSPNFTALAGRETGLLIALKMALDSTPTNRKPLQQFLISMGGLEKDGGVFKSEKGVEKITQRDLDHLVESGILSKNGSVYTFRRDIRDDVVCFSLVMLAAAKSTQKGLEDIFGYAPETRLHFMESILALPLSQGISVKAAGELAGIVKNGTGLNSATKMAMEWQELGLIMVEKVPGKFGPVLHISPPTGNQGFSVIEQIVEGTKSRQSTTSPETVKIWASELLGLSENEINLAKAEGKLSPLWIAEQLLKGNVTVKVLLQQGREASAQVQAVPTTVSQEKLLIKLTSAPVTGPEVMQLFQEYQEPHVRISILDPLVNAGILIRSQQEIGRTMQYELSPGFTQNLVNVQGRILRLLQSQGLSLQAIQEVVKQERLLDDFSGLTGTLLTRLVQNGKLVGIDSDTGRAEEKVYRLSPAVEKQREVLKSQVVLLQNRVKKLIQQGGSLEILEKVENGNPAFSVNITRLSHPDVPNGILIRQLTVDSNAQGVRRRFVLDVGDMQQLGWKIDSQTGELSTTTRGKDVDSAFLLSTLNHMLEKAAEEYALQLGISGLTEGAVVPAQDVITEAVLEAAHAEAVAQRMFESSLARAKKLADQQRSKALRNAEKRYGDKTLLPTLTQLCKEELLASSIVTTPGKIGVDMHMASERDNAWERLIEDQEDEPVAKRIRALHAIVRAHRNLKHANPLAALMLEGYSFENVKEAEAVDLLTALLVTNFPSGIPGSEMLALQRGDFLLREIMQQKKLPLALDNRAKLIAYTLGIQTGEFQKLIHVVTESVLLCVLDGSFDNFLF